MRSQLRCGERISGSGLSRDETHADRDRPAEGRLRDGANPGSSGTDRYRGRGPKGYRRSDGRIREDVCERLTEDPHIDASDIEVTVEGGEVVLSGSIKSRIVKHYVEDLVETVRGVRHVRNGLRIQARAAVLMGGGRTTGGRGGGRTGGGTPRIL